MCSVHSGTTAVNSGTDHLFDVVVFDSEGEPNATASQGLPLDAAISYCRGFNARPGRLIGVVVPSGYLEGVKLGSLDSEAPSSPVDASSELDDSGATESTEDAAEANLGEDSETGDEPSLPERNRRVVVMRGSGEMDIVSGLLTDDEACEEAEKFEDIEAVYTVRDWEASTEAPREPSSVQDSRARFIQAAVRSQLAVISKALPYVVDSGDIGLLAMSLREVAKQVDGIRDNGSIAEVPDDWGFDDAMGPEGWDNDKLKAALGLESEVAA